MVGGVSEKKPVLITECRSQACSSTSIVNLGGTSPESIIGERVKAEMQTQSEETKGQPDAQLNWFDQWFNQAFERAFDRAVKKVSARWLSGSRPPPPV